MTADRARALATVLHRGQADAGGAPLLDHIRRVVAAVLGNARVGAWLHEVLEYTRMSEEALLADGLSAEDLRALRLLTRGRDARSNEIYLAHIEWIARAKGPGAAIARQIKRADLADRVMHPPIAADGWVPPYQLALGILGPPSRIRR